MGQLRFAHLTQHSPQLRGTPLAKGRTEQGKGLAGSRVQRQSGETSGGEPGAPKAFFLSAGTWQLYPRSRHLTVLSVSQPGAGDSSLPLTSRQEAGGLCWQGPPSGSRHPGCTSGCKRNKHREGAALGEQVGGGREKSPSGTSAACGGREPRALGRRLQAAGLRNERRGTRLGLTKALRPERTRQGGPPGRTH